MGDSRGGAENPLQLPQTDENRREKSERLCATVIEDQGSIEQAASLLIGCKCDRVGIAFPDVAMRLPRNFSLSLFLFLSLFQFLSFSWLNFLFGEATGARTATRVVIVLAESRVGAITIFALLDKSTRI